MTTTDGLFDAAFNYHLFLPLEVRRYLNQRGIPDQVIDRHLLGWNGGRITIPIFNRDGQVAFFKLAKGPDSDLPGPKMLTSPGSHAELYGWERVLEKPEQIVICEGEFDRLLLEGQGIPAVTSTGGAGVFRPAWAGEFLDIPEVYVCFDDDEAGRTGALRVARLILHARIARLPEGVGDGGDVTDFFVRSGRSREDFLKLLASARPFSPMEIPETEDPLFPRNLPADPILRNRVDRAKTAVPIEEVIGEYVELRASGRTFVGRCPFHEDHNPSFTVYPTTRTFYCFGCRQYGDAITFLRKIEGLSFHQVLEVLEHLAHEHQPDQGNG